MSADSGLKPDGHGHQIHTDLFVNTTLLLLDLFFQPSQASGVGCSTVGL